MLQVTEKFSHKQDYAEETDGSDLNNTDCEYSSDDDCRLKKQNLNTKFNNTENIPTKRKREVSVESEKVEPQKKSKKTLRMESLDLFPCSVTLEPLDTVAMDRVNLIYQRSSGNIPTIENVNNMLNKETSDNLEKATDEFLKKVSENNHHIPTINAEIVPNKTLNKASKNSENNDVNLEGYKSAAEESLADTDGDDTLVIDEGISVDNGTDETILKESQDNENHKLGSDEKIMNSTIPTDSDDLDPIITEPEVILRESNNTGKDIIEINELDDSDVEITSWDTPKVPVQNKNTLQFIKKSSKFESQIPWLLLIVIINISIYFSDY